MKTKQKNVSKLFIKVIKVIYQGNYEKKRFIQSFKHREEILKLKIKIKNLQ